MDKWLGCVRNITTSGARNIYSVALNSDVLGIPAWDDYEQYG
jgi:hypothetical protein